MHIDLLPYATTMLCLAAVTAPQVPPVTQPLFTEQERRAIVAYWNAPGRYSVSEEKPEEEAGPWQVRLTAAGSRWFHSYLGAIGASKNPTLDPKPAPDGPYGAWEAWVSARLAYDRWQARQNADLANGVRKLPPNIRLASGSSGFSDPRPPGPMPEGLRRACGEPPPLAEAAISHRYRVAFDSPEEVFAYSDHVPLRSRYAYYRFPNGVVSYGTRLSQMPIAERRRLFQTAGFTPSEERVFSAISGLEGGFETVQTYDTGYVSVGFIQFVTLEDGRADLARVLYQMKIANPAAFQEDFRRFGVEIGPDQTLTVIDPVTGAELTGRNAVLRIIQDKRLTAVFQRAGRKTPFRVAQIKTARACYWPASDPITLTLANGATVTGTVGAVIRSEAGLATLLDRKINTGNLRGLNAVIQSVITAHGCRTLAEAARFEREIIAAMSYRENFLRSDYLAQPTPPIAPTPTPSPIPSPIPSPLVSPLPTPRPGITGVEATLEGLPSSLPSRLTF